MKIFVFTFLYFTIWIATGVYAGNTTLVSNYPAPSGSYNKIVIQSLATNPTCSSTNKGLIFIDNVSKTLQLCANGQATPVPSGESCFNRFSNAGASACPAGYSAPTTT